MNATDSIICKLMKVLPVRLPVNAFDELAANAPKMQTTEKHSGKTGMGMMVAVVAAYLGSALPSMAAPLMWGTPVQGVGTQPFGTTSIIDGKLTITIPIYNNSTLGEIIAQPTLTGTQPFTYSDVYINTNPGNGELGVPATSIINNTCQNGFTLQYALSPGEGYEINMVLRPGQNPGILTVSVNPEFNYGLQFDSYNVVAEPTIMSLLALGVSALGGGTNQVELSVTVSYALSFRVEYKDSLTNAAWDSLGTYSRTGAVTVATDTNTVPARFYRAVIP